MIVTYAFFALLGLIVYLTYSVFMFGVAMKWQHGLSVKPWYFRWIVNVGVFLAFPGAMIFGVMARITDKLSGWHT